MSEVYLANGDVLMVRDANGPAFTVHALRAVTLEATYDSIRIPPGYEDAIKVEWIQNPNPYGRPWVNISAPMQGRVLVESFHTGRFA